MVEKSLVLWYHTFYGSGASSVHESDPGHFAGCDLSSSHALPVGAVSDPAPGIYGAASKRRLFYKNVCRKERLQFWGFGREMCKSVYLGSDACSRRSFI